MNRVRPETVQGDRGLPDGTDVLGPTRELVDDLM